MLKNKLCRICMKQRKPETGFVKIFVSKEMGGPLSNVIIDFANVSVDQNDRLPHIICTHCCVTLIKCREFQKMIVQNDKTLSNLVKKPPYEVERIIAEPLIRIEKVIRGEESIRVQLDPIEDNSLDDDDPFASQNSSSEDEDDFLIKEATDEPIEAVKPRFLCCCCPLQFGEEHEIIHHMKTDHAAIRTKLNIMPINKDPKGVRQCELCLKYVVGFMKLIEHQSQYKNCQQCVECGGFYQDKG
jgi:Zinc-finger associated domain (zf-AD)